MIYPVCSKCKFLTDESVQFRPCPKIPIFHKNMMCSNSKNAFKDNVTGDYIAPYCEEVNRHGECLVYYPVGLEKPTLVFDEETNILTMTGTASFVFTTNDTVPTNKIEPVGEYDEESDKYTYELNFEHTTSIKAACIIDGVLSATEELLCEIPDVPEIEFDKTTNTVTINSYNKVYYTTDDSEVTDESPVYEGPFVIDHNLTVKAKSYARDTFSELVELECISIEAPVIDFDPDTNTVSINADDTILYSIDGSDIYDDSDVYDSPFVIAKNTIVKAACIVDGVLSEQTELECKVPREPVITYNAQTKTVTITSENPVLYTVDGSDVKKKDNEYSGPFKITQTTTIKAKSIVNDRLSTQAELICNV